MGKNKPRQNPDKKQNKMGNFCQYYEEHASGYVACEGLIGDAKVCKGNPHNCIKTFYRRVASRSNIQINNGDFRRTEEKSVSCGGACMKYINEIDSGAICRVILNAWIIYQLHAPWYIWTLYFFTVVGVKITRRNT